MDNNITKINASEQKREVWSPILWPLLPLSCIICSLAVLLTTPKSFKALWPIDCDPNGDIWMSLGFNGVTDGDRLDKDIFDPAYSLAISLPTAALWPFWAVKLIDIVWDCIVGRAWQAICGWVVYVVFRRCWAVQAERAHEGIPIESAMRLQYQTTTLGALWAYCRLLVRPTSRRQVTTTIILAISVLYVLLTPTWMNAMTGYVSDALAVLDVNDSGDDVETNYIPAKVIPICTFIIADGSRVGLEDDACIEKYSFFDRDSSLYGATQDYFWSRNLTQSPSLDIESTFVLPNQTYHVDPPLLNITMPNDLVLKHAGNFLRGEEITKRGSCKATSNTYKWGFSFHLTLAYVLTTNILALALYAVWLSSFRGKELADTLFGTLRTAVVVSKAIDDVAGEPTLQMSNAALERLSQERRVGIDLSSTSTGIEQRSYVEQRVPICDSNVSLLKDRWPGLG